MDSDSSRKTTLDHEPRELLTRKPGSGIDACLVIISGARLGARIVPDGEPVVIGREIDCDFQIAERSVSRQHCRIFVRDGEHWIEDLGSTNHTYVNGSRIDRVALRDGDQVRICETTLKFIDEGNIESSYHSELYETTIRDPLTGLFNRRHAMAVLETEVARARRGFGYGLSVVMLDIDFFKELNDAYGHLAGDRVLKQLSELTSARTRASDTLARIGGEEFLLIVPGAGHEEALALADDLRWAVDKAEFRFDDQVRRVTVSGGVATWTRGMSGASDLLRLADEQPYLAKREGRNIVC